MSRYVDEHRGRFGVEPICEVLDVSASAYYERSSGERSERVVEDERLVARIEALHVTNYCAYGYHKMWKALRRAGETVGRDRVERLMRAQRDFSAERPDALWLVDFERHEALCDRAVMKGHRGPSVAAGGSKLGVARSGRRR